MQNTFSKIYYTVIIDAQTKLNLQTLIQIYFCTLLLNPFSVNREIKLNAFLADSHISLLRTKETTSQAASAVFL